VCTARRALGGLGGLVVVVVVVVAVEASRLWGRTIETAREAARPVGHFGDCRLVANDS